MWNKSLIVVTSTILLCGCDAAVSNVTSTSQLQTKNVRDYRGMPIGILPIEEPLANVAASQKRVIKQLSSGNNFVILDKTILPIPESVGGLSKDGIEWRGLKKSDKLHLVIRHLERAPKLSASSPLMSFCEDGELYTGYMAAQNSLSIHLETETGSIWNWAMPYGLIACDVDIREEVKIGILPFDHDLFLEDISRKLVLKQLSQDHPVQEINN